MKPSIHTAGIAVGAALTGWMLTAPETVMQVWNLLPPEIVALIPSEYTPIITGSLTVLVAVSKIIRKKKAAS